MKMKIFFDAIDFDLWDAIDNDPFVPLKDGDGGLPILKPKNEINETKKKKVRLNARGKLILT